MAAPSLAIPTVQTAWNTNTTPKDTASFNVVAGDILVIVFASEALISAATTPAKQAGTSTISALTLAQDVNPGGSQCRATAWTASVTGTGTLTVRFARSAGTGWFGGYVRVWRGSAGVGTSNKGNGSASSTSSVTLTGVLANSAIDWLQADWNAGATTGKTYRTTDAGTFTETLATQFTNYTVYFGYHADAGAAASKAVGMTAPNQIWSLVAVEVKGSAGTTVTLTPATETDAAQALSLQKFATVTPAVETDAAQALLFGKNASVTPATETDGAQGLSFYRAATITPATEVDGAQGLVFAKNATLTPAVETNGAQALGYFKFVTLVPATEVDAAQALGLTFATFYTLTPATETDTAVPLALVRNITLTPATEADEAQALGYSQAGGGGGNGGAVQRVRHAVGVKQPDAEGVTSNL